MSLRRRAATALLLGAVAGCVPDEPMRGPVGALLAEARCRTEASELLDDWGAVPGLIEAPPGARGTRIVRVPTDTLGVWIVIELPSDGREVALHRVAAGGTDGGRFDERCRLVRGAPRPALDLSPVEPTADAPAPFTDDALATALRGEGANGLVVYAWSPHMPLSVDGWREIDAAARALGLTAVPVLVAHADPDFAWREAARAGIPPEGLRAVASVELIMRDLQVHAPAILVFGGGRVSPVLPGYRNAEGYRRFLEAFFAPTG